MTAILTTDNGIFFNQTFGLSRYIIAFIRLFARNQISEIFINIFMLNMKNITGLLSESVYFLVRLHV